MISDTGESKTIDSSREIDIAPGVSYGCIEFRAPEVHGPYGWTTKADMWALGVNICKMLQLRAHYYRGEVPEYYKEIIADARDESWMPMETMKVLRACLRVLPDDRYDAKICC